MSRILIVAAGLTGHTYPNIHLASALNAAGFDVQVVASERYRRAVEGAGARFVRFPSDYFDRVDLLDKNTIIDRRRFLRDVPRHLEILYDMVDDGLLDEVDFALLSMFGECLYADCLVRGVPFGIVEYVPTPVAPTDFPLPQLGFGYGQLPPWVSRLLFHVFRRLYIGWAGRASLARFRKIGFTPPRRRGVPRWLDGGLNATCIQAEPDILREHPYILAISPALLVYPYMGSGRYWLQANSFTGRRGELPGALRAWLGNGESRPIFFGYGSLQGTGAAQDARTWLTVLDRLGAGQRGIFSFSVQQQPTLAQQVPELKQAVEAGRVRVIGEVDTRRCSSTAPSSCTTAAPGRCRPRSCAGRPWSWCPTSATSGSTAPWRSTWEWPPTPCAW